MKTINLRFLFTFITALTVLVFVFVPTVSVNAEATCPTGFVQGQTQYVSLDGRNNAGTNYLSANAVGLNLASGSYLIKLNSGAISRWEEPNDNATQFTGGRDILWSATTNAYYLNSSISNSFQDQEILSERYFRTQAEAASALKGNGSVINVLNSGSSNNLYLYIFIFMVK